MGRDNAMKRDGWRQEDHLGAELWGFEAFAPFAERKADELMDDVLTYIERVVRQVVEPDRTLEGVGFSVWVSRHQEKRLLAPAFCLTGESVWDKVVRHNLWFVNTGEKISLHGRVGWLDSMMKIQAIFDPVPWYAKAFRERKNIIHEVYGV